MAKKSYFELMKTKEELLEVKSSLLKVKPTLEINRCLDIIKNKEKKIPSEEEILKYSFYNAEQEESLCNIYVFIGAYCRSKENVGDIQVSDYTKAHYFVYQNLEKMFSGVVIYPQEYKQFEKDNIVLRFNNSSNVREKFSKLQCIYFREYLQDENISQDKMLEKLRKNL